MFRSVGAGGMKSELKISSLKSQNVNNIAKVKKDQKSLENCKRKVRSLHEYMNICIPWKQAWMIGTRPRAPPTTP